MTTATNKSKSIQTVQRAAALRLLNDIAIIDTDLARKIKPGIDRFVESIQRNTSANKDLFENLVEFMKIKDIGERKTWLLNNADVIAAISPHMKSVKDMLESDQNKKVVRESDSKDKKEDDKNGREVVETLEDAQDLVEKTELATILRRAMASILEAASILGKIQPGTKYQKLGTKAGELAADIENAIDKLDVPGPVHPGVGLSAQDVSNLLSTATAAGFANRNVPLEVVVRESEIPLHVYGVILDTDDQKIHLEVN